MFSKLSKPRQRSKRFFSKNLSVLRLFNKIIEYSIKRKYGHSSSFGLMASLNKLYDEIENFRILRLNCTGRSFFFRRRVQIELNEPVGKKLVLWLQKNKEKRRLIRVGRSGSRSGQLSEMQCTNRFVAVGDWLKACAGASILTPYEFLAI